MDCSIIASLRHGDNRGSYISHPVVIELCGDLSTGVVPGNDSCRPTQLPRPVCMGGGKSRAVNKVQGKLRLIDMLHV